jgi:hypothetical protein
MSGAAPPRSPQPVHSLRVPAARFQRLPWSLLFDLPITGDIAGEILTQVNRPHIAMSCQSSFAWKASLTRTPPPICTSALGSQTALIWRAVGVANNKTITPSAFSDNPGIRRRLRLFATVAAPPKPDREYKLMNLRTDSRVSQSAVQYQKKFINNLRSLLCRSIFQSLFSTMCISNSRSVIFHDYFCRVTPVAISRRESRRHSTFVMQV